MEITLSLVGMGLVPVVVGLTSIVKIYVDSKWAPLVSLAFSVALAWVVPDTAVAGSVLLGGVMIGLAACGLYSGVKTLTN